MSLIQGNFTFRCEMY